MEKFPLDVSAAERLTNGDPNIINREDFSPNYKKRNQSCWADVFKPSQKGSPRVNKCMYHKQ